MSPRNTPLGPLRRASREIYRAALEAVDPERLIRGNVSRDGGAVVIQGKTFDLNACERVFLISVGKAGFKMAAAMSRLLGARLDEGIVVIPEPAVRRLPRLSVRRSSHPLPEARSLSASRALLALAHRAGEKDLVFVLLSGGSSSLACLPGEGISLDVKRDLIEGLLKAGADIRELNVVRKHLSAVKGGRLAQAIYPAVTVNLIISDVIGNDLGTIGSGPTHWDSSTFRDAMVILKKYGLWETSPRAVREAIAKGLEGLAEETLKPGHPVFGRVHDFIIGDNLVALRAARQAAERLGFEASILTDSDRGEARIAARDYVTFLSGPGLARGSARKSLCYIAGGELTVSVTGTGKGGRNTEFVLACLVEIAKTKFDRRDWLILSLGTDGRDGSTDAAGAWIEPAVFDRIAKLRLEPLEALGNNDSYGFFEKTGHLIRTGPTRTNVMDLRLFLLGGER